MTLSENNAARAVTWQRNGETPSFEQAQFVSTATGRHITGTVLAAQDGAPLRVDYRIECDEHWKTRRVYVEQRMGGMRSTLLLERENDERWLRDRRVDEALTGCTHVDLGISPSTNTLPIRQLAMAVGGASEIQAAWIRFPELTVTRACQRYRRVSERQYQYQNLDSGFTASIIVDADGLVEEYGGVWTRVAEGPAAPDTPDSEMSPLLVSNKSLHSGPGPTLKSATCGE